GDSSPSFFSNRREKVTSKPPLSLFFAHISPPCYSMGSFARANPMPELFSVLRTEVDSMSDCSKISDKTTSLPQGTSSCTDRVTELIAVFILQATVTSVFG